MSDIIQYGTAYLLLLFRKREEKSEWPSVLHKHNSMFHDLPPMEVELKPVDWSLCLYVSLFISHVKVELEPVEF